MVETIENTSNWFTLLSIGVYILCLLVIFLFSLVQLSIAIRSKRNAKAKTMAWVGQLPLVTVQIPIFNEGLISKRIIDAVAHMDYPKSLLQIQILDDSTDETFSIIRNKVNELQATGIIVEHLHRANRSGYKAGALRDAMSQVKGEFIAIFDVDFIPNPDFLKKALTGFYAPFVGVVQTRWGHINSNSSVLTALQAFGLDGHFMNEQNGRVQAGLFLNFNGTAGIWRKSCIENAGGWSHDTLTEDLDLSYRAQLKGWKINYLINVVSPAELPITMSALKTQQHRWMKGGAECFLKNSTQLLRSKEIGIGQKLHGLFHLFNSSVFLFVVILSFVSLAIVHVTTESETLLTLLKTTLFFFISTILLAISYWFSFSTAHRSDFNLSVLNSAGLFLRFIPLFFGYLIFSLGLSLHNAVAVLEGYFGIKTSFVRTPKFNILRNSDTADLRYDKKRLSLLNLMEGISFFIFAYHVIFPPNGFNSLFFIFHLMLTLGYGLVFFSAITEYVMPKKILFQTKTAV